MQAREDAEALAAERLKMELAQQALRYERRVQELEVAQSGGWVGVFVSCSIDV